MPSPHLPYLLVSRMLFFDSILPKYQCEFRRGFNAQHCLITLIEKWKKSVDNGGGFGALFTDIFYVLMKFYNVIEFYDVEFYDSKLTTL